MQVMGQDIKETPSLFINNYKVEVIHEFVYIGSPITDSLSMDNELNKSNWEGRHETLQAHKMCMVYQQSDRTYQNQCI